MRAGDVMAEAWDAYKEHFGHLVPLALVVYLLIAALNVLLVAVLGWLGIALAALIGFAGVFWLQGALVVAIEDVRDGRADLSIRETLSRVSRKLNTLTLAGLLAVVGITLGLFLLVVPGLVLLTWWLLIVPVIMLEDSGVLHSFGRSRELVRGHGWSVFGVIVLTVLVLVAVAIVFGLVSASFESPLVTLLFDVASRTLSAPFVALAWTMTYYRLRTLEQPTAAAAAEPGAP
jgi:hypothetical protein